tara:strand:- start:14761 stop:16890 length:2130 start_codon:yes stop_codon:yes gene_type:complete
MDNSNDTSNSHFWRFRKVGKTFQVQLESPEDLKHLRSLDPKLWVALSCPVDGLEVDRQTLTLIDNNLDGRVRIEEILAAIDWTLHRLSDPASLFEGGDLPLAAIQSGNPEGKAILTSAQQILDNINRSDSSTISVAKAADMRAIFGSSKFNGDGIIARDALEGDDLLQAFDDIVKVKGTVEDRSGRPGIDSARVNEFMNELRSYEKWWAQGERDSAEGDEVFPLGADTPKAFQALIAVEKKIDDYFARCRLAAFDGRAEGALNREAALFDSVAKEDFSVSREEVAGLPLARVAPGKPLPISQEVNPEWAARIENFRKTVLIPLSVGNGEELIWDDWLAVRDEFVQFRKWHNAKPVSGVEQLGVERIRAILQSDQEERLRMIIEDETKLADRMKAVHEVERLARMHRDLIRILRNYVNFEDFYEEQQEAIFQAGTLYLDGREFRLCLKITDPAKHSVLGSLSRTYLAYCECKRKDVPQPFFVAAVVTAGDSANLLVGRNGVFRDRSGRLWDSTIVRIVENPISIREAFFMPYVRIGRFIGDQVEKWASSRDAAMQKKLESGVSTVAAKPQKDAFGPIGGMAALLAAGGIALGAIGAGLASLFATLGGLKYWEIPLVFIGLILLISLPSMFIAWMRLRRRTLAPLLDAAGWAVNGRTAINFKLGSLLTRRAELPPGARIEIVGGAAARTWLWVLLGFTVVISCIGWGLILF